MPHLLIGVGRRVDRPVTPRVLHDQKAAVRINAEVVTAPTGTCAERQPVVELIASIKRLAQFREITFTAELDTKLLSDLARTSVTPHEVRRPDVFRRAVGFPYQGGHSGNVLSKVHKLRTISDGNAGDPLCPRLEERFQSVLRDELVGLKWPGTVTRCLSLVSSLLHRGILQMQQRRPGHGEYNVYVHRAVPRQACGPYRVRQADATIHFHGASVATLHLG